MSNLMVAERLKEHSGYTWTLASRLGDMLMLAEERFGCRDLSYTILGIGFVAGSPKVWYPGGRKNIVIQLGLDCAVGLHTAKIEIVELEGNAVYKEALCTVC